MKNLKVGDKVRCILWRGGEWYTVGKLYEVNEIIYDRVLIPNNNGTLVIHNKSEININFELVGVVKPTAVLVTTKREFDLLMGDYKKRGLKNCHGDYATKTNFYNSKVKAVQFKDRFEGLFESELEDYDPITFEKYAKIAGIEILNEETVQLTPHTKAIIDDTHEVITFFFNDEERITIGHTHLCKLYETYKLRKG